MEVKLLPWQRTVYDDKHRFKVVCAGRRSGKSVLARIIVLDWAIKNQGVYYIVSPSYRQSKAIFWRAFQREIPLGWIKAKNEVDLSITLQNGSIISLKGGENPDSLRGVALKGLVVDEIASIRNWEWLWDEVLRATLTDYEAPALFISTPLGFNHFHQLYQLGQGDSDTYKSWTFTTYDNRHISAEEIAATKKELTGDTFKQEYEASFQMHTGLAHKNWDRKIHLIKPFDVPDEWQRARGFDYGLVHFTASVRVAIDNEDNWFLESCYLNNKSTVKEHADAIRSEDYHLPYVPCWGDPSGKQWVEEFAMHNLHIQNANKTVGQGARGWVEYCVERVNERLKPMVGNHIYLPDGRKILNAPRLLVLDNGKNDKFVSQIERLSWKRTITGENVPVLDEDGDPTNGHYDLMAAMRYLAVSYEPEDTDIDEWRNIISEDKRRLGFA